MIADDDPNSQRLQPVRRPVNQAGLRRGGPPEKRWKPGVSGNPAGRPKGINFTAEMRRIGGLTVWEGVPLPDGQTVAELVVRSIYRSAIGGNMVAAGMLVDRIDGRAPHQVNVDVGRMTDADLLAKTSELMREYVNDHRPTAREVKATASKPTAPPPLVLESDRH